MLLYRLLDYFFLVFHLGIVIFNLFGWIWPKTRKANLVLLLLTAASWFGLGLIYGIGFCPFTEWHWQVLEKLGSRPVEDSYMQYLYRRVFHLHFESILVNTVTAVAFFVALAISLILNIRDLLHKRRSARQENEVKKS